MLTLPAAFSDRMKEMPGGEYSAFVQSYERPRRAGLRINTLRDGWEAFAERAPYLQDPIPWADGLTREDHIAAAYYCDPGTRPGKMALHEAGVYYLQEPSAMAVASLAGVLPGQRVLDLCAAPGGKSTHLASFLQGRGLLVSNEIHPARAKILSQNIERMGIMNAVVTNEPPQRLAERFPLYFDVVVVDAPCSGEGMFLKEEAAIPNWSPENVEMCAARQKEILEQAALMVAPGGRLVYSTCTFSPQENEGNAAWFLAAHPEFSMVDLPARIGEERMRAWGFSQGVPAWAGTASPASAQVFRAIRLWPHKLEGEGHFVAVFEREGTPVRLSAAGSAVSSRKGVGDRGGQRAEKEAIRLWEAFVKESLCAQSSKVRDICGGVYTLFGSELYSMPCAMALGGCKVLRAGLHLGTVKKNRFEPAHALAMALSPQDARLSAELGSDSLSDEPEGESRTADAYLRGESLSAQACRLRQGGSDDGRDEDGDDSPRAEDPEGWCLVTDAGFPLGWGKAVRGRIKNHYPKGLRRMN